MRWRGLLFPLVLVGCGDSGLGVGAAGDLSGGTGGQDLAVPPDLAVAADLAVEPPVGKGCPVGNECAMGLVCLDESFSPFFPPAGYCTKMCKGDADCGAGAYCTPDLGDGFRFCVRDCSAGEACGAGRLCSKRIAGYVPIPGGRSACLPGNPAARDGSACATFGDCNHDQACLRNPYSLPGGMCVTVGCTPGNNATCLAGGDGVCIMADGVPLCIDSCNVPADCRANEKYTCAPIPNTLLKASLFPNRGAGAACKNDGECAYAGSPWRCLTGMTFPGGYCSAPRGCDPKNEETCPFDGSCHDPTPQMPKSGDEHCARRCGADGDCRAVEGYRCLPLLGPVMGLKVCRLP